MSDAGSVTAATTAATAPAAPDAQSAAQSALEQKKAEFRKTDAYKEATDEAKKLLDGATDDAACTSAINAMSEKYNANHGINTDPPAININTDQTQPKK